MYFGFPEDKIPGTLRTNCSGWKVKIKRGKCKISRALRLVDGIYPCQLTVDVGPLKKGGSGKSEIRGQRSEVRTGNYRVFCFLSRHRRVNFCFGV